jgi:hypothetical protein
MTPIKLIDNLGGVVGIDYLPSRNQLFFVEYAKGFLSTLAPGYGPIEQNTKVLAPKSIVDLDKSGSMPDLGVKGVGEGYPKMYTIGEAKVHVLSATEYFAPEMLPTYIYSKSTGFYSKNFAILTNSGNYCLVEVETDKILIDDQGSMTITTANPLKLEEGYVLAIKSIDIDGNKAYLELTKDGAVVDSKVVQVKEGATIPDYSDYYYRKDGVEIIRVHFKNIFRGADQNLATVDRIRQVSDGSQIRMKYTTYAKNHGYKTLGKNYQNPEDIVVTSDGLYAYITERVGNLLRVSLSQSNADRGSALVVAKGLKEPHQIALDEGRSMAYLVEFASGRLLSIDLASNKTTSLISNLEKPAGLLMSKDFQYAYITEQTQGADGGRLSRINLSTGNREVLVKGLVNPFFMAWANSSQSSLFLTERAPANKVTMVDLKTIADPKNATFTSIQLASMPAQPSGIAIALSHYLLVGCDSEIDQVKLDETYFNINQPLLLGIGFVPFNRIKNGYADTTSDKGYFFQVVDAAFGGNLPIMFNHEKARDPNRQASWYSISFNGKIQKQSWWDYRWDPVSRSFVLTAADQTEYKDKTYYRVRNEDDLWYNYWLGGFIDTTSFSDGQYTIEIETFDKIFTPLDKASLKVQIDNQWPRAVIEKILYYYDPKHPELKREIPACGIAQGISDEFSFLIEATDPISNHLLSWYLFAVWGDNQSALIDSGSYGKIIPTTPHKWEGVHQEVPAKHWHASVPGDITSRKCAHTFYLAVWDRVINGWDYLHYSQYHKSITIFVI